ncbi:hypothetical protein LCGC14_2092830 [marine sediment metagenome]|uniref:Uncharacterized protein n=1 Tax=marine sediment metagenome TaxID=412755 RepID=A0A0F9GQ97_9ZZZZ
MVNRMKKNKRGIYCVFIALMTLNYLILSCLGNTVFTLSLRRNDVIIYEYNVVNTSLLYDLGEEHEFYKNLSLGSIEEHSKIKLIVDDMYEDYDYWIIEFRLYNYSSNNLIGYMNRYCAKFPEVFVYQIYSDGFLDILPANVNSFLLQSRDLIAEYNDSSIQISDHNIIFDYTAVGDNYTFVFNYNQRGILDKYSLLYKGSVAFEKTLIAFSSKDGDFPLLLIIFILVISCVSVGVGIFIYKKKTREKNRSKKLLKHIR